MLTIELTASMGTITFYIRCQDAPLLSAINVSRWFNDIRLEGKSSGRPTLNAPLRCVPNIYRGDTPGKLRRDFRSWKYAR